MPQPDKVAAVAALRAQLTSSSASVLTEYRGLTVQELADLRARLRPTGATYVVVKNTLTRIAAKEAGAEIPDELLVGPTAVAFCADDPVSATKVLRDYARDAPELVVKGAWMDGALLDAAETLKLAELESREELLARLAGLMTSTIAQPARLAAASLSRAARLFAALAAKRQEAGETADAAVAADPAPAAPQEQPAPADS